MRRLTLPFALWILLSLVVLPGALAKGRPGEGPPPDEGHGTIRAAIVFPSDRGGGGWEVAQVRFKLRDGTPVGGQVPRVRLVEDSGRSRDFYGVPSTRSGLSLVPIRFPNGGSWEYQLFNANVFQPGVDDGPQDQGPLVIDTGSGFPFWLLIVLAGALAAGAGLAIGRRRNLRLAPG